MPHKLIQRTLEILGYEFKVERIIGEAFIRDIKVLNKYHYCLLNPITYRDKRYIYFYSFLFDSCLRLLITSEEIEWFWTPKQFAYENNSQDIVDMDFPQVLFPLDDDITCLINFADKIYNRGNIVLQIDSDGVILTAGNSKLIPRILDEINSPSLGTIYHKNRNLFGKPGSKNYGFKVILKDSVEHHESLRKREIVKLNDFEIESDKQNSIKVNANFIDFIFTLIILLIKTIFWGTLAAIAAVLVTYIFSIIFPILLSMFLLIPISDNLFTSFSNIDFLIGFTFFALCICYFMVFSGLYDEEIIKNQIRVMSRRVRKQPNNIQLHMQRGDAYLSIRKYDLAIDDYDYVIKKQPKNLIAHYLIIAAYEEKKEYDKAITCCKKVIKNIPKHHEIYFKLADLKRQQGDLKSAVTDLDCLLKINIRNIKAHQDRAEICYISKDYNNAITSYKRVIELNPDEPYNYYRCASCFERLNDVVKAKHSYQNAILLYEKYNLTNNPYYNQSQERLREINK